MVISQEQIKKEIMDQLFWDTRVDAADVQVQVEEGSVTLSGTVPNNKARMAAEADAWTVQGVEVVSNRIGVRHYEVRPSDRELLDRVRDVLRWNPYFDENTIDVAVVDAVVTLKGFVDTYWKKINAEVLSFDIAGVVAVVNELAVVPSHKFTDRAIANDILAAYERDRHIDVNLIDVKVESGRVTLDGTAKTWSAFHAAQHIAENTYGVIDVENHLTLG